MVRRLTVLLIIISIAGCGFKLRGLGGLPPHFNKVAIVIEDIHHGFEVVLKDNLQAYQVQVVSDPIKADYTMIIEKSLLTQQINSVSSSTTPRQYELVYTVVYSLNQKGKPIVSSNVITIRRQFTLNNDRVLSSNDEGSVIVKEMYSEASIQIINLTSKKLAALSS